MSFIFSREKEKKAKPGVKRKGFQQWPEEGNRNRRKQIMDLVTRKEEKGGKQKREGKEKK